MPDTLEYAGHQKVRDQFLKALCDKATWIKSRPIAIAIGIEIGIEPDSDFDPD